MTWLKDYCAWASQCTDAPAVYHKWAGYSALAAVAGRRFWLDFGPQPVAPNLYVMLLGRAAECRKSTAVSLSRRVAAAAGANDLPAAISSRGLLMELRGHPQSVLYSAHTTRPLFGALRRDATEMLAELHDSPSQYCRLLRDCRVMVTAPCLNILSVANADDAARRLVACRGNLGLWTRFILVPGSPAQSPLNLPPPADVKEERRLAESLQKHVEGATGAISLEDIRDPYLEWADGFKRRARTPLTMAFAGRLARACLKVALLEEISEGLNPEIGEDALKRAIESIESVADSLAMLERDAPADLTDPDARDIQRIERMVKAAGKIRWSELLHKSHMTVRRMTIVLDTLQEAGQVQVRNVTSPEGYPQSVVFWIVRPPAENSQSSREIHKTKKRENTCHH